MQPSEIRKAIEKYRAEGKSLFTTSSFQSHSIVLLHILSEIDNSIPVYFLDTGYHFPETLQYRDMISEMLGQKLINLRSNVPLSHQRTDNGRLLYTSDPDYCCHINKVLPMEKLLRSYDVWINGVRADQNANRASMKTEQPGPHHTLRFHPMLGWTSKMIFEYMGKHKLPRHPLEQQGYLSIGCEPCTRKIDLESLADERHARWFGLNKTECGLHTELIHKEV